MTPAYPGPTNPTSPNNPGYPTNPSSPMRHSYRSALVTDASSGIGAHRYRRI